MPNPLTVEILKNLLKRKHRGRAKGIMARIEKAEGRTEWWKARADKEAMEGAAMFDALEAMVEKGEAAMRRADGIDPEPPTEHPDEYLPNDIHVPSIGNPAVLSFPVTDRPEITVKRTRTSTIVRWQPTLDWKGKWGNLGQGETEYFGNVGEIYHSNGRWQVIPPEWMRNGVEVTNTSWPYDEKYEEFGEPTPGMPRGYFVASFFRAGWTSERKRRTWVQWFDPETWERIEVPDFTVPTTTEDFVYTETNEEYELVNSAAFLKAVMLTGVGSGNILLPDKFRSKRWRPGGNRTPGTIVRSGDVLRMTWEPIWEQTVPGDWYGNLHMIYPTGPGGYVSAALRRLVRPGRNTGTEVDVGSLPYTGPGLCGFILTTVGDHIHQRKTDVHAWRFTE